MHRFPVVRRHHLNRIPGTTIEKRTIGTLACTFLTSYAQIRIYFDSPERRMVFIGHPEHAGFNRTVLDAGRRPGTAGATVGRDGQYPRALLTGRFPVALRHWPVFFYDVVHPLLSLVFVV